MLIIRSSKQDKNNHGHIPTPNSGTMKPLQNPRSFCGAAHPEPFQFPESLRKTATLYVQIFTKEKYKLIYKKLYYRDIQIYYHHNNPSWKI
jgi:hypothetical protein